MGRRQQVRDRHLHLTRVRHKVIAVAIGAAPCFHNQVQACGIRQGRLGEVEALEDIEPGFPRWIANLVTCLGDSAIRTGISRIPPITNRKR